MALFIKLIWRHRHSFQNHTGVVHSSRASLEFPFSTKIILDAAPTLTFYIVHQNLCVNCLRMITYQRWHSKRGVHTPNWLESNSHLKPALTNFRTIMHILHVLNNNRFLPLLNPKSKIHISKRIFFCFESEICEGFITKSTESNWHFILCSFLTQNSLSSFRAPTSRATSMLCKVLVL